MRRWTIALAAACLAGCSSAGSSAPSVASKQPQERPPPWQRIYHAVFDDRGTSSPTIEAAGQIWVGIGCTGDVQDWTANLTYDDRSVAFLELRARRTVDNTYANVDGAFSVTAQLYGAGRCSIELRGSPHARWSVAHGA